MKCILMIGMILFSSISFGKTPSKEFMSKKIGIWVPALSEPEAKAYTLLEFTTNAFRNVVSQEWEDSSEFWILTVKVKDPMTKKKSTIKMQFLKSDAAAGPRRIVMDGEDYPMLKASPLMHSFIENVAERVGARAEPATEKATNGSALDRFIGKYCKEAVLEINSISGESVTISGSSKNASCNFKDKVFRANDAGNNEAISIVINANCRLYVEPRDQKGKHLTSVYLSPSCSVPKVPELNDCTISDFDGILGSCGK